MLQDGLNQGYAEDQADGAGHPEIHNAAGFLLELTNILQRLIHDAQDMSGVFLENAPAFSNLDAARGSAEQPGRNLVFEA
jgi:hypothetical protein